MLASQHAEHAPLALETGPERANHASRAALLAAPDLASPPAGPACGQLGVGALLQFRLLMAQEGQSVQVARMAYDRLYAYDRIAAAHACAHDPLRRLALELFQAYHWREQIRTFAAAS